MTREVIIDIENPKDNDLISRDAVLNLVADYDLSMGQVVKGIHALPSVTLQPCEDAISRQAVIEQINCWIGSVEYKYTNATYYLTKRMQGLPPVSPQPKMERWIPCSERLPRASEIVLLSLPEHTMVDGEECYPCVICGHYIGGNSEEWGISDGTTVGYGLVAYKHCKPVAWMPLPEPYKTEGSEKE